MTTGGRGGGFTGSPAPEGAGASPEAGMGRLMAAVAHLGLVGPLLIAVLAGLSAGDGGAAGAAGFAFAVIWFVADVVIWLGARRLGAREVAFHASQAALWSLPAIVVFFVLALISGGNGALALIAFLPGAAVGAVAARRVLAGEGHRYWLAADLAEGRGSRR